MSENLDKLKALFKQLNSKNIVYNKVYYRLTKSVLGAVLLSHLSYLHSECFGGREFYQSDNQLMDSLGFSEKTLRTAKSHISKFVITTKRGLPAKNHWVVLEDVIIQAMLKLDTDKPSHAENGTTVAAENGTTGAAENGPSNNKELQRIKNIKINNKQDVESLSYLDEVFEVMWKNYPLKKGKQTAATAFKKIFNTTPPQEAEKLIESIKSGFVAHITEHRTKSELKKQGADIWVPELPHLSTWLNNRRWEDEHQNPAEILHSSEKERPGLI